jgi:hypothetical protein
VAKRKTRKRPFGTSRSRSVAPTDIESKNGVVLDGVRIQGSARLPSRAEIEVGRGGPKIRVQFVEGGSGISFTTLRKTGVLRKPDDRPLVSTDDAIPAYTGTPHEYLKPKPVYDTRTIAIVGGALLLAVMLIAYLALSG